MRVLRVHFKVEINERIVLVELLDEIHQGKIKNIWVFNSDRLGRHTQSWWSIYKVLLDTGVTKCLLEVLQNHMI